MIIVWFCVEWSSLVIFPEFHKTLSCGYEVDFITSCLLRRFCVHCLYFYCDKCDSIMVFACCIYSWHHSSKSYYIYLCFSFCDSTVAANFLNTSKINMRMSHHNNTSSLLFSMFNCGLITLHTGMFYLEIYLAAIMYI